jgi:hypothetical protein
MRSVEGILGVGKSTGLRYLGAGCIRLKRDATELSVGLYCYDEVKRKEEHGKDIKALLYIDAD